MSEKTLVLDEKKFESYPQQPHGGKLVNRVLTGKEREQEIERAAKLPMIMIDLEATITIEMIATGVLSPNEGFMQEDDYKSVLKDGRLANGLVWPVPLSFAPVGDRNQPSVASLSEGDDVALVDHEQEPVAIRELEDIVKYNKDARATHVCGTHDSNHPG